MPLPINSVAQAFTEQQQRQADIGNTQASTMQRLMNVAIGNAELKTWQQNQESEQQMRDLLYKQAMFASAQNNPNAPVDQTGQTQTPPGMTQDPLEIELGRLRIQQQQYKQAFDTSSVLAPRSQYPTMFMNALTRTDKRVEEVTKQLEDKRNKQDQQIAQVIGGMNNQESMDAGFKFFVDTYGVPKALEIAKQFPIDGRGMPEWGDKAKVVRDQYVNRFTTVHEANTLRNQIATQELNARKEAEREAENQRRDVDRDARMAQFQHGLEIRERAENRREEESSARIRAMQEKRTSAASKPATSEQKKSARSVIESDPDFENVKFEPQAIDALAADVADRAHQIRADAAKAGDDMGLDDARQQAWEELKPFVRQKEKGGITVPAGVPLVGGKRVGGETVMTYTRSPKAEATGGGETDMALIKRLDSAGIGADVVNGKVTGKGGAPVQIQTKAQRDLLPVGTQYIGPDGKTWTKQ